MDNIIKQKRLLKNYSQQEMAKLLNISYFSYNRKEKGTSDFTQKEITKLKIIFGLTPEEIDSIFFTKAINC